MNNSQLINQTSNDVEWYTPQYIIEAVRSTMGSIDLDPASCAKANETVNADRFFTIDDDGLTQNWWGNVWLNHPFSRSENATWVNKAESSWLGNPPGVVSAITMITFASTSESWFQPLFYYPQCYLSPRVHYIGGDGQPVTRSTKGSVVTYMGPDPKRFAEVFGKLGRVMIPPHYSRIFAGVEW